MTRMVLHLGALAASLALAACSSGGPGETPPINQQPEVQLDTVARGLSSPVYLTAPAGDSRLFVVEQGGRIRVIENGALRAAPFLDIAARISSGGERGLLSVAFHPRYAENRFLYVHYTDRNGDTRVERYTAAADGATADPASAKLILAQAQPFANHNGGLNLFGPDGMLYIGLGDGGSGGDPQGNGQKLSTLLGKLLRIDVDGGDPYAIPAGNPFAGRTDARPEIWAYGLRNPWRFAFDRAAGMLYVADVGQNEYEEVNVVPAALAGANYGWNVAEAKHCYGAASCQTAGMTVPALEYSHAGGACSVTGGVVYRGTRLPALVGHYLYADYCAGFLRAFRWQNGAVDDRALLAGLGNVTSFGEDAAGEVYVLTAAGLVLRLAPAR